MKKSKYAVSVLLSLFLSFSLFYCVSAEVAGTIDYHFDDGSFADWTLLNGGGIDVSAASGIFGKSDFCVKISALTPENTNPHLKMERPTIASDHEYLHIRASIAAENTTDITVGLGAKLRIKTETGEEKTGFLETGTPIEITNRRLRCFGKAIEGAELYDGQFYTVDVVVNVGEGVGTTMDVYINGGKKADDLLIDTKVAGLDSYQLIGLEDLRLNISNQGKAPFSCYFDDVLCEVMRTDERAVLPGLEPNGIEFGGEGFIKRAEVEGKNADEILAGFSCPENASAALTNKLGKPLSQLTKRNYICLTYENGLKYIYKIETKTDGSERFRVFYSNDMRTAVSGMELESGIGGKASNDTSAKPSSGNVVNITNIPDGRLDGKKLVVEMAFFLTDHSADRLIEACSGSGIFAPMIRFNADKSMTSCGVEIGEYTLNQWYQVCAVVEENLSFELYINGDKKELGEAKFTNVKNDSRVFDALTRIKMSFNEPGGIYIDDFQFVISQEYPYDVGGESWLSSDIYKITPNGVVVNSPNIIVEQLLNGLNADDEIYVQNKAQDEIVGFNSILHEKTDGGEILYPIIVMDSFSIQFKSAGNMPSYELGSADSKPVHFEISADSGEVTDYEAVAVIACYKNGCMTNFKFIALGAGSHYPVEDSIDAANADCVEAWVISDFTSRKPYSRVFRFN